ncbi:sugar phosphate isomerase/epimerase, partial [bacterium]|nr:sugar phosphate isomerase/epimerase [bacterium]
MYKNLSPGAVGIRGSFEAIAALAARVGFQGIDLDVGLAAARLEAGDLDSMKTVFADKGLVPGGFGLPVDFRKDDATFEAGLAGLPRLAEAAAAMDCRRCMTWILPGSDDLTFEENFDVHRRRLGACAGILKENGIALGLEFVGPKTARDSRTHEFIWTLPGMLQLGDAIGTGNIGLLLDCWHWYTSEGTVEELRALRPEQVVYVHVNDAPDWVPIDEHVDNERAMPGETDVIDIAGFLG